MYVTLFLFLAGLVALGFLGVVWRKREMPPLLRAILTIGAIAIVAYVALALTTIFK